MTAPFLLRVLLIVAVNSILLLYSPRCSIFILSEDKLIILLLALSYFLLVCFLICRQSLAKSSLRVGTLKTYLEVLHSGGWL